MRTPVRTPVRTSVCTPHFSDAYISAKNEDNALKLSGYIKNVMDEPMLVPLFIPLLVPQIFQMLIFQSKMKIMPRNFQDIILWV